MSIDFQPFELHNVSDDYSSAPEDTFLCVSLTNKNFSAPDVITTDDEVHISYAIANSGTENGGKFLNALLVDGKQKYSVILTEDLQGQQVVIDEWVNLGKLSAGQHEITLVIDRKETVEEDDETNNTTSIIIDVQQGNSHPIDSLVEFAWEQSGDGELIYEYNKYRYNKYTPEECLTGCVSTACGQVLYYWAQQGYDVSLTVNEEDYFKYITYMDGYQKSSKTIHTDTLESTCSISLEHLNELLAEITYDSPNEDDDDDIAAMGLAGMLILNSNAKKEAWSNPNYDTLYLTSTILNPYVFERANFHSKKITTINSSAWATIREDVLAGRPALIGSDTLNHVVIVDGYNESDDEYHLNFGWGESSTKSYVDWIGDMYFDSIAGTGWYSMAEMSIFKFSKAIVNIYPNYDKPSIPETSGAIINAGTVGAYVEGLAFTASAGTITLNYEMEYDNAKLNVIGNTFAGTLRFFVSGGNDPVDVAVATSFGASNNPLIMQAGETDGVPDMFIARANGTWSSVYEACHSGILIGEEIVGATEDMAALAGKNKISDVFHGAEEDVNVLYLLDNTNGDALFLDDIYSETGDVSKQKARIESIKEIFAGAGDDIIDMTSSRFEYNGSGMTIHGGNGNDVIWANRGENRLYGDAGDDIIVGSNENDIIIGGTGNDIMNGNGGDDIFYFGEDWGNDIIYQTAEGSVTLMFATSCARDGNTFTEGDNSVTVEGTDNIIVSLEVEFGEPQNSSTRIFIA